MAQPCTSSALGGGRSRNRPRRMPAPPDPLRLQPTPASPPPVALDPAFGPKFAHELPSRNLRYAPHFVPICSRLRAQPFCLFPRARATSCPYSVHLRACASDSKPYGPCSAAHVREARPMTKARDKSPRRRASPQESSPRHAIELFGPTLITAVINTLRRNQPQPPTDNQ